MADPVILTDADIEKLDAPKFLTDDDIEKLEATPSVDPVKTAIPKESVGDMLLNNLKEAGQQTYREGIAPILEGGSTFAAGIPRLLAKAQGKNAEEATFPEQKTAIGKVLRGMSEVAGFTAGAPGQLAKMTANAVGKGAEKLAMRGILKRVAQGTAAGAVGGFTAGSDLKNRQELAAIGGIAGGVLPAVTPVVKGSIKFGNKAGRLLTGVDSEVLKEVEQKGFRNVINNKYLDKKLPEAIQMRIEQNLDKLEEAAGKKYSDLTAPLRQSPFDMAELRGQVVKIANRVNANPFDTDVSKVDKAIFDGIINKAKVNNLGDALDLRRNLDDVIYNNSGELKSSFGKEVRNLLNKELHKNAGLKQVDADWTSLQAALREGRKVTGETGENFLKRFSSLTAKQKQMLSGLEKQIGGKPFVKDITNWSLAQKFTKRTSPMTSLSGIIQAVAKPAYRGMLRSGEAATQGVQNNEDMILNIIKQMQK